MAIIPETDKYLVTGGSDNTFIVWKIENENVLMT